MNIKTKVLTISNMAEIIDEINNPILKGIMIVNRPIEDVFGIC